MVDGLHRCGPLCRLQRSLPCKKELALRCDGGLGYGGRVGVPDNGHHVRVHLGPYHLGGLVGMGCAPHLCARLRDAIRRLSNASPFDRGTQPTGAHLGGILPVRLRRRPDCMVFDSVVAHTTPTTHAIAAGDVAHAAVELVRDGSADRGAGADPVRSGRGGPQSSIHAASLAARVPELDYGQPEFRIHVLRFHGSLVDRVCLRTHAAASWESYPRRVEAACGVIGTPRLAAINNDGHSSPITHRHAFSLTYRLRGAASDIYLLFNPNESDSAGRYILWGRCPGCGGREAMRGNAQSG